MVSNIFSFSPLLGEIIQVDWYFSNGLKPPTRWTHPIFDRYVTPYFWPASDVRGNVFPIISEIKSYINICVVHFPSLPCSILASGNMHAKKVDAQSEHENFQSLKSSLQRGSIASSSIGSNNVTDHPTKWFIIGSLPICSTVDALHEVLKMFCWRKDVKLPGGTLRY